MHSKVAQEPWSPANPGRPAASPGLQLPAAAGRRVAQSRPSGGKECGTGVQWRRNAATAWWQRRAMRTRRERTPSPAPAGPRPEATPAARRAAQPPRRGPCPGPRQPLTGTQGRFGPKTCARRTAPRSDGRQALRPALSYVPTLPGPGKAAWQGNARRSRPPKNPTARRACTQPAPEHRLHSSSPELEI